MGAPLIGAQGASAGGSAGASAAGSGMSYGTLGMLAGAQFLSNYLMAKRQEAENRRDRIVQSLANQQAAYGQQAQNQMGVMQGMTQSYRSAFN